MISAELRSFRSSIPSITLEFAQLSVSCYMKIELLGKSKGKLRTEYIRNSASLFRLHNKLNPKICIRGMNFVSVVGFLRDRNLIRE